MHDRKSVGRSLSGSECSEIHSFFFHLFNSLISLLSADSYVSKGEVVSLEVVNKKWARVYLGAGSSGGPVSDCESLDIQLNFSIF